MAMELIEVSPSSGTPGRTISLLKYTLPIIADFKNLQNIIPGEEEEGAWLEEQEVWEWGEDEEEEIKEEEEEVNDWSRCCAVEHLLEWEERGSALASRTLAFLRL